MENEAKDASPGCRMCEVCSQNKETVINGVCFDCAFGGVEDKTAAPAKPPCCDGSGYKPAMRVVCGCKTRDERAKLHNVILSTAEIDDILFRFGRLAGYASKESDIHFDLLNDPIGRKLRKAVANAQEI